MTSLIALNHINQTYKKASGEAGAKVLDDISLTIQQGEIVGLLGRSGCGKSTLLRIISGLIKPSEGEVLYQGAAVHGPAEGIAMVFQSFALFPWLTVLENVELGLEALHVNAAEARKRALQAIDLIGLDGYESAYPKELSGGMRQRVGFARALVVNPNLLLMDEPFSALDVLTAETLRTDLLDLWVEKKLPIKAVLLVTHNIEEAVLMCDRIVILSSNPGRIATELAITLPHPRNRLDAKFRDYVDQIYARMTQKPVPKFAAAPLQQPSLMATALPHVSTNALSGFLEVVSNAPFYGKGDLPHVADELTMEIDELFPVAEMLHALRFAEVAEGDVRLTEAGQQFVTLDTDDRKKLFRKQLIAHVPLAAHIRSRLDEIPSHRAPASRFREELEDHLSEQFADTTLRAVINLGRYAELFAYDEQSEIFSLEDPN